MIQNERQYGVTKSQLARLETAQKTALDAKGTMPEAIYNGMLAGLKRLIGELQGQLVEYDELRTATHLTLASMEELPDALIKARVARGLTQKDLADLLKVKPQQIQKYEFERYKSASLRRVLEVAEALHISFHAEIGLRRNANTASGNGDDPAAITAQSTVLEH